MMKSRRSITEELLREAWLDQRFASRSLKTIDGRPIAVIDPGQQNDDSGPDFKQAKIKIGDVLYRGDVEIHRTARDWTSHSHDRDPQYNQVILHAVMYESPQDSCTESGRELPELVTAEYLDQSLFSRWDGSAVDQELPRIRKIKCSGLNDGVDLEVLDRWVLKLAQQRLELKVRKFEERLKQLINESRFILREPYTRYEGDPSEIPQPSQKFTRQDYTKVELWDQLIYEGLMEGLGYSKNQQPMLTVARNVTLQFLRTLVENSVRDEHVQIIQAALFGAAGLLPSSRIVKDKQARSYLRDLRRHWKQMRPEYKGQILHPAEWHFFRLRPQNFPTLRLAAASVLIVKFFSCNVPRTIFHIMKDSNRNFRTRFQLLRQLLSAQPDEFWSKHYMFDRAAKREIKTLIGVDRINDIIVNTLFPISLLYARIFRDLDLRAQIMDLLSGFPALSQNTLTRTMERELLKGKVELNSSAVQQGVIQLFTFYCREERCSECDVGKIVFSINQTHPENATLTFQPGTNDPEDSSSSEP